MSDQSSNALSRRAFIGGAASVAAAPLARSAQAEPAQYPVAGLGGYRSAPALLRRRLFHHSELSTGSQNAAACTGTPGQALRSALPHEPPSSAAFARLRREPSTCGRWPACRPVGRCFPATCETPATTASTTARKTTTSRSPTAPGTSRGMGARRPAGLPATTLSATTAPLRRARQPSMPPLDPAQRPLAHPQERTAVFRGFQRHGDPREPDLPERQRAELPPRPGQGLAGRLPARHHGDAQGLGAIPRPAHRRGPPASGSPGRAWSRTA